MRERSLVAFTLLSQGAVGLFWAHLVAVGPTAAGADAVPLLLVGPVMVLAMAFSLLHLGSPLNAWRALANLRSSWLSREILFAALFTLGWAAVAAMAGGVGPAARLAAAVTAGSFGVGLVYSMARVYRLRTVPAWRTRLTTLSFFLTTGALGALACAALAGPEAARPLLPLAAFALAVELWLERGWAIRRERAWSRVEPGLNAPAPGRDRLRPALLWAGLGAVMAASLAGAPTGDPLIPAPVASAALVLAFAVTVVAEARGRAAFYGSYARTGL